MHIILCITCHHTTCQFTTLKLVGDQPTDGPTNQPTDRRTLSRIELLSQLKIEGCGIPKALGLDRAKNEPNCLSLGKLDSLLFCIHTTTKDNDIYLYLNLECGNKSGNNPI